MDSEYDEATARHYAAYRPPLHERILRPVLGRLPRFDSALDIGCGAGHSTVALAPYTKNLVGTDASKPMISAANGLWSRRALFVADAPHSISWTFRDERFGLLTLAGSLAYLDREEALDEIFTIARHDARVVVYDFDVELDGPYHRLGYQPNPSDYRHDVDLSEDYRYDFKRQLRIRSQLNFTASSSELVHLLLSVRDFRFWAEQTFSDHDPHSGLVAALGDEEYGLTAKTWCSLFAFQR